MRSEELWFAKERHEILPLIQMRGFAGNHPMPHSNPGARLSRTPHS